MIKKISLIVLAILAALAIVFALGGIKFFQVRKAIVQYASFSPPPQVVTSLIAKEEEWVPALRAVGSTAAVQGVTVSTDEPGIVQKINFESGQTVKVGDLLVQLEVSQEEAQLRSAEAQMRLAGANLARQQNLLKGRVSSQADYDTAQAQYDQAVAKVEEVKALINKKTIRAPFSGARDPGRQSWPIPSKRRASGAPPVARPHLREFLAAAAKSRPDCRRTDGPGACGRTSERSVRGQD
jgi:membrane fusion protein (multidrug efflux system)